MSTAPLPLHIVDIAHYDHVTSFASAATAGIWGVIHKATTGATGRDDEKYAPRRPEAVAAGLLWGAYHWGTNANVSAQVDHFLKVADPDTHTLVALDFESDKKHQMSLDQAREFLTRVAQRLGRKAVLYSGDTIKTALGNTKDAFFGSHRLWLAHYDDNPKVQASWDHYWLWQYTDKKKSTRLPTSVAGIPGDDEGNLDCDAYNGTKEQLATEWAS